MIKINNSSLRRGFLFNFLFFSTIPLIIVSIIISIVISNSIIETNYNRNAILVDNLKNSIENFLEIPFEDLLHVKQVIEKNIVREEKINEFLDSIITNETIIKSIRIADKNGIIKYISPYDKNFINSEIPNFNFFKNLKHNIYWTDTFLSFTDFLPIVTLVYQSTNYFYIFDINIQELNNLIKNIKISPNSYAFIVDRNNVFITHTDYQNVKWRNLLEYEIKRECGNKFKGNFVKISNKDYLLNFENIENSEWKVGIIQPAKEIYLAINKAVVIIFIGTILSFGFALLFSLQRVKKILKPMTALTLNSKEIIRGNYNIEFTPSYYKEIQELSTTFEAMIKIIKIREEQLKNNEKNLKEMLNNLPIAVAIFQKDGEILFFNIKFKELFGYNKNDISMEKWLDIFYNHDIYEEILKLIFKNIELSENSNTLYKIESRKIKTLDNEEKIIDMVFSFYNENIILNFIDITEKYSLTEKLKSSLKEKEIYLKEIHHRVKNNLQIINALLNLQKRKLDNKELIEIFSETQNRILTMSTVHEELYKSNNLGRIDLKNLINNIITNLFRAYRSDKPIYYNTSIIDVEIPIDIAIPLGLIITEIVSNSFKYAFVNKNYGEINITLNKNSNSIVLTISDNGNGLPKDFDISKTESLGMNLIYNLTNQIKGSIKMINENGLSYIIEIPV